MLLDSVMVFPIPLKLVGERLRMLETRLASSLSSDRSINASLLVH